MTVYNSAYETTATQGFVMQKVLHGIKEAAYSSQINFLEGWPIMMVEGAGSFGESVPSFAHPVSFPFKRYGSEEENWIAIDVRSFGRWDQRENKFIVSNQVGYNLAVMRAKLSVIWTNKDKEVLRDISQLPMVVFSSWLSENLARRFALEPHEQFKLSVLAGIFYYSLFHNEVELDERNKVRVATAIARNLRCSQQEVNQIIDECDVVPSLTAFCQKAAEIASPVRLEKLSPAIVITLLGGTWYGTNDKEQLATALEHPPTWIAMLMAASSERYYHSSQLARLVDRNSKGDIGKNFVNSVTRLLDIVSR